MEDSEKLRYALGYVGVNLHGFGLASFIKIMHINEGKEITDEAAETHAMEVYNYLNDLWVETQRPAERSK
jgi:hypothetical protein